MSADTDSDEDLPPGWEERVHTDGRVYYADHQNESTHWTHPKSGKRKVVPQEVPFGWSIKHQEDDGSCIFVEEASGKETTVDPRLAFKRTTKNSLYDFKQRFDATSTALEVLHGVDLSHKRAFITGANSGIGFETARSLAMHRCEVILACRSLDKAEEAAERIIEETPSAKCECVELDLCSLRSVQECSNELKLKYESLDIFILNAGIFAAPFALTEDNFERTFQINHLAQFYLTMLLKPLIIANHSCRMIVVSSESHRWSALTNENLCEAHLTPMTAKDFTAFYAYNDSKLCNVLFASELNRRWSIHGVTCNSLHPGNMVSSNLSRHSWFYGFLFAIVRPFAKSLQQAAATTVWASTGYELDGIGGQYFNNCWLCPPADKACDVQLANAVWNISVKLIERATGSSLFEIPDLPEAKEASTAYIPDVPENREESTTEQ